MFVCRDSVGSLTAFFYLIFFQKIPKLKKNGDSKWDGHSKWVWSFSQHCFEAIPETT